jgi:hypothetical protein
MARKLRVEYPGAIFCSIGMTELPGTTRIGDGSGNNIAIPLTQTFV